MLERLCRTLLRWRGAVLVTAALLAVLAALIGLGIRFEFSFTQFFPSRQQPVVERYFQFMERFGRDDRLAVLALSPVQGDIYRAEVLSDLAELTTALAALDGVERVTSLASARLPTDSEQGLVARPLYDASDGVDEAELAAVRAAVASNPLVGGQLVSVDGRAAALIVELDPRDIRAPGPLGDADPVLSAAAALADARLSADLYTWHLGGVPAVRAGYIGLLAQETWRLLLAAAGILALALLVLFRSWRAVFLPLATVLLSTLLSVAALVISGHGFTLMSTLIPAVVLIIGIADSVHFLARFQEEREQGHCVDTAIVATFKHLAVACLLTSATTAVGFLALGVSAIGVVADFGVFAALGVMLAYLVTVLVMPPLLSVLPIASAHSLASTAKQPTGRFLALHFRLADRRARRVVLGFLLVAGALAGWSRLALSRNSYFVDDLDPGHPLVAGTRFIEQHFGGILPLEVVIEGPAGLADDPAALALCARVARHLEARPEIGAVLGYAEVMTALSEALAGDRSLVESRAGLAQLRLLAEGADGDLLGRFVGPGGRSLRVSARVADLGSSAMEPLLSALNRELPALADGLPELRVELNGFTPAALWVNRYMVDQLFYGFALAFLVITLMTGLLFRSPLTALVALLPNLIPLIGVLAWMSLFNIALKPTTAIIFSVSFGLGVDNTIHFLTRFRGELRDGRDARRALSRTLAGTGRGILFASLVLALGFTAVLFAQLGTSANFAALTIVTIASAQIAVLLLLPCLLLWPHHGHHPLSASARTD